MTSHEMTCDSSLVIWRRRKTAVIKTCYTMKNGRQIYETLFNAGSICVPLKLCIVMKINWFLERVSIAS